MFGFCLDARGALRAAAAIVLMVAGLSVPGARAHAATPFYNVASRSMEPTLLLRDHLLAFPLPKPMRGDLVAYRHPKADAQDSRLPSHRTVPAASILARLEFIYFSVGDGDGVWRFWNWPRLVRWNRIFMRVR